MARRHQRQSSTSSVDSVKIHSALTANGLTTHTAPAAVSRVGGDALPPTPQASSHPADEDEPEDTSPVDAGVEAAQNDVLKLAEDIPQVQYNDQRFKTLLFICSKRS